MAYEIGPASAYCHNWPRGDSLCLACNRDFGHDSGIVIDKLVLERVVSKNGSNSSMYITVFSSFHVIGAVAVLAQRPPAMDPSLKTLHAELPARQP